MTWQAIAGVLGRSYPALLRQFEAGDPVYRSSATLVRKPACAGACRAR